jgi:hypothetical protein
MGRRMKMKMETGARSGMGRGDIGQSMAAAWALLRKTERIMKQSARESAIRKKDLDRRMRETDRRMQETDRQMQETDRRLGALTNRFGELAEHLVLPNIREKFRAMGYEFDDACSRREIFDADGRMIAEVDIWLENAGHVMVVEVKARLTNERIDKHIERIERIRERFDTRGDRRRIIGAAAGAIMSRDVRDYAVAKGLYAIGQSGDTVKIDVPEGFTPREW